MALFSERMSRFAQKPLDTADIVRDACLLQLSSERLVPKWITLTLAVCWEHTAYSDWGTLPADLPLAHARRRKS